MPKSKTPKTYRVRVVNPSRPGAPRFMGEENPAVRKVEAFSKNRYRASPEEKRRYGGSTVTQFYVRYVDAPHETKEITGYGKTPGERKTDAIRKFRQHESTVANPTATDDPRELVDGVFADYYSGEIGREEIRSIALSRARRWGADEGAVLDELAYQLATGFPARNPKHTGTISAQERKVLEDLRQEAIDSEDDWGIDQETRDYLEAAASGEADQSARGFLNDLAEVVDQNFGKVGEEGEDADPFYSRDSANRAHASIQRARRRLPNPPRGNGRTGNPRAAHTDTRTSAAQRSRNPDAGATSARARALSRRITG